MPTTKQFPRFDADGFLLPGERWSEHLARDLAASSGIGKLTDDHWQVLYYLREHYFTNKSLPPERNVCRAVDLPERCEEKLFGSDLNRAWRIAGLPNPGEEAKVYMGQKSSSDGR